MIATKDDKEAVEILLTRKKEYLTEWETHFLIALWLNSRWSARQQEILDVLWDEVFLGNREPQP